MAAKGFLTVLLCFSCVLICASQSSDETTNQLRQVVPISDTISSGLNPVTEANIQNRSVETIDDFSITGAATTISNKKKNVHAILSVVGWGILFPIGSYLRISCGCPILGCIFTVAGYIIGVAGWGTGMKLGHGSPAGSIHDTHRILGILIFCFAHVERFLFCCIAVEGPAVTIVLSIINIYLGFAILQPDHHKWRNIYTGVLIFFGCIASVFEITKCIICCLFGPGDFCYNCRIERRANERNQPRA